VYFTSDKIIEIVVIKYYKVVDSLMIKMALCVPCMNYITILFSDLLIISPVFFIIILLNDIIINNLQQCKKIFHNMTLILDRKKKGKLFLRKKQS